MVKHGQAETRLDGITVLQRYHQFPCGENETQKSPCDSRVSVGRADNIHRAKEGGGVSLRQALCGEYGRHPKGYRAS